MIVSIDRSTGTDAGADHVEEKNPDDRRPPPPPDRPGQEPEGVPSRLESRTAVAAANEQAAEKPAEATDKNTPKATSEHGSVIAERKPESPAASLSAETSETTGKDRSSAGPYDAGRDQPGTPAQALAGERDTHAQLETGQRPQSPDGQTAQEHEENPVGSHDRETEHQPGIAGTSSAADTSVDQRTPDESAPTPEMDDGSASQATDKFQTELDAETSGGERGDASAGAPGSTEFVSPAQETPYERGDGLRNDPVSVEDEPREGDRRIASSTSDASAGQHPLERTDQPHEVKPPEMVRDYYTNIPPTVQERYLVRDQSNPVPVFDGPPTRDQAVQGSVGDCGIVATLGSVAEHHPDTIKNAIKQVGDGKYEITLHEVTEASPADPVARPTGDVKTYRVNDELPVATDDPQRRPAGIQAESCGWPALMEKVIAAEDQTWDTAKKTDWDQAWAEHKPAVDRDRAKHGLGPSPNDAPTGFNRLDIGSTAYQRADLLAKLTGEDAEVRRIPGERQGEQALLKAFRDQLNAGKPVLVGTRGRQSASEKRPFFGFEFGHAYEITKVEADKIHLRNPWGGQHTPPPIDAKAFWEYCRHYNYDGTRDGHYTTLK